MLNLTTRSYCFIFCYSAELGKINEEEFILKGKLILKNG